MIYLPKDVRLTVIANGARTVAPSGVEDWQPAGRAQFRFPLARRWRADLSYGLGAESFFNIDRFGRFAAHTYAGGLQFRLNPRQEIRGYFARQLRSGGKTQTSIGVSYALRF